MRFETVGQKKNPVVIMLNGSFSTGKGLMHIARAISNKFYVILPTYDGHYQNGGEFTTREKQAKKIISYLKKEKIKHIALIQGASMGAEIALTLAAMLSNTDICVEHYLFDGGPFFHFCLPFRMIMRKKFKAMVHQAQNGSEEEIIECFSNNKMVQWMIHGDISPYKWFIQGLAEAAPHMSDRSISKESDACYTFDFPAVSIQEQKKYYFIWSTNEPAFKSAVNVQKHYPYAKYNSPGALGHCGFISRQPEKYAKFLMKLAGQTI